MSEKTSVLLSDVTIKGDIIEKERLVIDAKIDGDVTADKLQTHSGSKINGNISSTDASLGGTSNGNINSDLIKIKSTLKNPMHISGSNNKYVVRRRLKTNDLRNKKSKSEN